MDDKNETLTETSEYKFDESESIPSGTEPGVEQPSSEFTTPEEGMQSTVTSRFGNINWKRFLRPALIVVAILLVYGAFSFYSSRKAQTLEQQKIVVQKEATFEQAPSVLTPPKPLEPEAPVSLGVSEDQMVQMQKMIQQKIDGVMQQLVGSQARVSDLTELIYKTQQDLSIINQKLEQLAMATQQLVLEIEKMKAPKVVKKKVTKSPVAYHIRAIVPGRVWLESANGKSVTLRVGDKLEGYGEVRVIAPQQGMVIMSNGAIIQYGVNDF